jgi:RNA polymerase sigma factor (sigma-70 family)
LFAGGMMGSMRTEPPATSYEELLTHAAWLRRLATALVGPANDPEDLAQEAWVAALRHPPRPASSGESAAPPLRSWLAEVLRNAARMRSRGAGRRLLRDGAFAADAPDDIPSAEALLERLHTQRMLAGLVAELAEPYRSTLLLHYYEGLPSAEIARLQQVPAGTVRWRLKTGLDKLRASLDDGAGGDRRLWCAALLPLAHRAPSGWVALLKSSLKGALMMTRTAKIVGAATLVAAAGTWAGVAYEHAETSASPAAAPRAPGGAETASRTASAASAAEARRTRDAMRADIVEALRKRDAAAPKAPAPPPPPAATARAAAPAAPADDAPPSPGAARGHYEPAYIQSVFREAMFPLMRQCYENALAQKPALAGKIALDFTIVADPDVGGVVDEAELAPDSDLDDSEMATCIRESLLTLTFDKPPSGGGYVTVKYPVEFSP